VNILPGRDGLLHISKLSALTGGKRVNQVEDVLTLGQPIEVRVDDIDPQGKVSLSLAGDVEPVAAATSLSTGAARSAAPTSDQGAGSRAVSFEESFEAQLQAELGDLGPASQPLSDDDGNRRPRNSRRRR